MNKTLVSNRGWMTIWFRVLVRPFAFLDLIMDKVVSCVSSGPDEGVLALRSPESFTGRRGGLRKTHIDWTRRETP